ncbi:MAG TPA: sigma-54 dependent transcriptional regulator [Candidatus Cloacimonadota bacterium]|nr:sigma-54 dependent transcriptional regulator [Candidatus Cloacimonadota bacterium]
MKDVRILIADDDINFCMLASDLLISEGFTVQIAHNMSDALSSLAVTRFDILMLDMCFPTLKEGFSLLDDVRELYPRVIVLMISGSGHIPDAVTAIKNGAFDFIEKPITPDYIRLRIRNLAAFIKSRKVADDLAKTAIGMVGDSMAMRKVFDNIIRAGEYSTPVLITGETGVGKELAAHAIHRLSRYGDKSMVCINCASIPKDLFESELFGHEMGAFTGAVKNRKGYFEFAEDNTIFLDEISEMPVSAQAKLLRVISEGEIQKVGGKVKKVNTRIIAATNREIGELLDSQTFRQDLYYRLNSINIHIPPLRERKDDIPALATYFISEFCNANHLPPLTISFQALNWLYEQPWKGNARELRSVIERGVIFANNDHLTISDLTSSAEVMDHPLNSQGQTLKVALHNYEKSYIEFCLREHNGNVTKTAEVLGIDKSNLFKKINHYGISTKQAD